MSSQRLPSGRTGGDRRNAPSRSTSRGHSDPRPAPHRHLSYDDQRPSNDDEEAEADAGVEYEAVGPAEALVVEGPAGLGESMMHAASGHQSHHLDQEAWTGAGREGEREPLLGSARAESAGRGGRRPWYRRPSPAWLLPGALVMAAAIAAIIAPKLEIYNQLVCRALTSGPSLPSGSLGDNSTLENPPGPTIPGSPFDSLLGIDWTMESPPVDLPLGPAPPFSWDIVLVHDPEMRARSDEWAGRCRRSPKVSSAVARLNTALTLTGGVLSSLTTGFWGGVSDRRGRKVIVVLSLLGFFINDLVFLVTVSFAPRIPYQFLVLGPFAEGVFGGFAAAGAGVNAYISDCTPPGSRATSFATIFGVLMAGMALGPTLGGLVIRWSGGNVLAPFYAAAVSHATFAIGSTLILPESLGSRQKREARLKEEERRLKKREEIAKEDLAANQEGWSAMRKVWIRMRRTLEAVFGFLRPIGLLLPRKGGFEGVDISWGQCKSGANGRDWNLTIIAAAYALYMLMLGVYGPKLQYTMLKFDWSPVENGFYLTVIAASRVLTLLVVLPLFIRLFKPKGPAAAQQVTLRSAVEEEEHRSVERAEGERGKSSAIVDEAQRRQEEQERHAKHVRLLHDSHFDLKLARYSMLLDMLSFLLLVFNTSPAFFIAASAFQSLGGGASPAVQSLALSLAPPHHAGKVLASLSVLSSTMSSVLGPLIFGLVFAATAGTFPETIFVVGTAIFGLSSMCLLLVRLKKQDHAGGPAATEAADGGEEAARGRSRSPRHATSGSVDDPFKGASASAFVLHRGVSDSRPAATRSNQ